jgi:predicted DNA-binding transcriptional regulator YafY
MSKSGRLLKILNIIRSNRSCTAAELARQCGVSERTIYRDIVALSEAGAPVFYDNGYKLLPGTFLPPLNLNVEEYLVLKAALQGSPFVRMKHSGEAVKSVLTKVNQAVNSLIPENLKRRAPKQLVSLKSPNESESVEEKLTQLRESAESSQVVLLNYRSLESEETAREVEPFFVVFRRHAWYLVAYCRTRQDVRLFRVDRIISVESTGKHFPANYSLTPERYFRDSWEVEVGEPKQVIIRFRGKAARIMLGAKHQVGEQIKRISDNEIEYRATVAGLSEISRWLVGFGVAATVVEPAELQEMVLELANGAVSSNSEPH